MKVLSEPGRITDEILMLDALGWNYQKTTSTFLVSGRRIAIVEPASRSSAKPIMDGVKKFGLDLSLIHHIFVTHRHFDHAAGAPPLSDLLPNARIMAHRYTIENYKNPQRINEATRQIFGESAEPIEKVGSESKLVALEGGDVIDLGEGLEIEAVPTPGHTSDHFSFYERKNKFLFTGDSAGLFGTRSFSVIPAAFPPSFKFENYKKSIERMLGYDLKIVGFAHFGAVVGPGAREILEKSLETLEEWRDLAERSWTTDKDTEKIASILRTDYQGKLEIFSEEMREGIFPMLAAGLIQDLFR